MKDNINALDEVNKGCSMGVEAVNNLIDKVDDKSFKKVMEKQLKYYEATENKIKNIYNNYNDEKEPHEIGAATKLMTDYMMSMKTMIDHTDSKIAELLMQGTNMGIIEGRRIINNKKLDKEVEEILNEFVSIQEKEIENLKKYL